MKCHIMKISVLRDCSGALNLKYLSSPIMLGSLPLLSPPDDALLWSSKEHIYSTCVVINKVQKLPFPTPESAVVAVKSQDVLLC